MKIGDLVRLKPSVSKARGDQPVITQARIIGRYSDIKGGVILDAPIQGYRSWNVADLIVVRDKK